MKEKNDSTEEENDKVTMYVSREFKDLCDEFQKKKIDPALWNVGIRMGYPAVTKIIARKIRDYLLK